MKNKLKEDNPFLIYLAYALTTAIFYLADWIYNTQIGSNHAYCMEWWDSINMYVYEPQWWVTNIMILTSTGIPIVIAIIMFIALVHEILKSIFSK